MIGQVATNKVSRVLDPPYIREDGSKEKNPWTRFFILLSFLNIPMILSIVAVFISKEFVSVHVITAIIFFILLDVYVFYKYIQVRVLLPKEFNATIEKYGRAELMSQIAETETKAFFVAPEVYDCLTIVTRDYLINANEMILSLKDVKDISFIRRYYTEEQLRKNDREPNQRLVMSHVYYANITFSDGKKVRKLVAVLDEDMEELIRTLRANAPHATFS